MKMMNPRKIFNKATKDSADGIWVDDESELKESIGRRTVLDDINLLMIFYNRERSLRLLYDKVTISIPLVMLTIIFTFITLSLSVFGKIPIMTEIFQSIGATILLFGSITLIVNAISKAELRFYEVVNIILNGYVYIALSQTVFALLVPYTANSIIIFSVINVTAYAIFLITLSYFCSYTKKILVFLYIITGILFGMFSLSLGLRGALNTKGTTSIADGLDNIIFYEKEYYNIVPSDNPEQDYEMIYKSQDNFSAVDMNGNLISTLPSSTEDIFED